MQDVKKLLRPFPLKGLSPLTWVVGMSHSGRLGLLGLFSWALTLKSMCSSLTQKDIKEKLNICSAIHFEDELETLTEKLWKCFPFNISHRSLLEA